MSHDFLRTLGFVSSAGSSISADTGRSPQTSQKDLMTNHNPFAAPTAQIADPEADASNSRKSRLPRYIVAVLIAVQLAATWRFSWTYFELVRTGAARPLALLFGGIGSICLYVAAILALAKQPRGQALFLVAAVSLGLSVPMWGLPYAWSWVAGYGALLGVLGWWITRRTCSPSYK